jgi:hypothetical protein
MMRDLFAPKINDHAYLGDPFRWVVAMFQQDGATQVIIRAHKFDLATYYPIGFSKDGEPVPLWRNYVFLEWKEQVTLDICRDTPNFLKVLSAHDDEGIVRPILVRRNHVDENGAMVLAGKYNERQLVRRFYGRGSLVRVIEGVFMDKRVRLEENILPEWRGSRRVKVDIDGIKGSIELYKLSL